MAKTPVIDEYGFVPETTPEIGADEYGFVPEVTHGTLTQAPKGMNKNSYLQALVNKLIYGASAGTIDELAGVGSALEASIANIADKVGLDVKGREKNIKKAYEQGKVKESIKQNEATRILGNKATLIDILGGANLPVGKVGKMLNMMKTGAGIGALEGFGRSNEKEARGISSDVIKGSILGLLGGAGAGAINKMAPTEKSLFESIINQGNPKPKLLKEWSNKRRVKSDIGQAIQEAGGIKATSNVTLEETIEPALNTSGQEIERIVNNISDIPDIQANELISLLENKLAEKTALPATKKALKDQIKIIKTKYENKVITPNDIRNIIKGDDKIQGFDESINYLRQGNDQKALSGQELLKEGRGIADDYLDNVVLAKYAQKANSSPAAAVQELKNYKNVKQTYSDLKKAEEAFTEAKFQKQKAIGSDNPLTTIREKVADPIFDVFRFGKVKTLLPYFKYTNQEVRDLLQLPYLRGQKINTLMNKENLYTTPWEQQFKVPMGQEE